MFAHIKRNKEEQWEIHKLEKHLEGVGEIAGDFAVKFFNKDWAKAASLLHDIGKGSDEFQRYISDRSGYETEVHIENVPGRVVHSTQGAGWAYQNWGEIGKILAYLIAGHHGGLPDWNHEIGVGGNLEYRLQEDTVKKLPQLSREFIGERTGKLIRPATLPCGSQIEEEQIHFWIRMLYSCLVDADFLDTEQFMDREKFDSRGKHGSMKDLKKMYDAHMFNLTREAPATSVNKIRTNILSQCRKTAKSAPGLFSLTVPTGGGKTLSAMAFALEHALEYKKERIIMVIPYTSIIEQTAQVYKEIFHADNVIEHHSSLDPDKETSQSRLASENWDAPIIVTTSVQFFESLFASRSSACRKLHNIVNSVVILDEVQMLPTDFLKPIVHSIKGLSDKFGVSLVLCTATQPAITGEIFEKGNGEHYSILKEEECREIMVSPSPEELVERLQRVEVGQCGKFLEWDALARELEKCEQALCIVNTRNDCRDLYNSMPGGTVHLSANMCGEHRSRMIEGIKSRLKKGEVVRVVSTQLVEAGVDFDFPVVFRAMAGFDSIAQAAGRCNREGELRANNVKVNGKVFVFDPPKPAPPGILRKGEQVGRMILSSDPEGCKKLLPQTFKKYFENYFSVLNSFDKQNIESLLVKNAADLNFQFRTAAQKFNLIDDKRQVSIVVWYEGEKNKSKELIERLRYTGPYRELMRKLQRFTVSIPENIFNEVKGSFEELHGIWCQKDDTLYDPVLGFVGYKGDEPIVF